MILQCSHYYCMVCLVTSFEGRFIAWAMQCEKTSRIGQEGNRDEYTSVADVVKHDRTIVDVKNTWMNIGMMKEKKTLRQLPQKKVQED